VEAISSILSGFRPALPLVVALGILAAVLLATRGLLQKRYANHSSYQYRQQLIMLAITAVGLIVVILVSPLSENQEGELLRLIGILFSGAIALSSTTLLGNALAGFMLRAVRSFRMGDFVSVGDYFGRVSGRGLFHTEIQTDHRDLVTLPNLFLATNPVKVVRESGTIISADVSLGYEVPRTGVEGLLLKAAKMAELTDPFVHVIELGDFSVVYRVSGLLPDVKGLIRVRSRLREEMLDSLHTGGIEIVSPGFTNRRSVEDQVFVPPVERATAETAEVPEKSAEEVAFDKAEEAESAEELQQTLDETGPRLEELEKQLKEAKDDAEREQLEIRISQLRSMRERLEQALQQRSESPSE
jgi:small-conductance mechanosensitive channel